MQSSASVQKLSVIVITKNEAPNIRRCLRSVVGWVDEIIVLDSGSTDQTPAICRHYTSSVYITDWVGYGPQKNRALALAHGEWVLSLDADEWVRPDLQREILRAITREDARGFILPRLNMFCGRFQRHGDAAKDQVLRLFRRDSGRFTNDLVHEKVICRGKIGCLQQPLLHNSYRSVTEWAQQMEKYAVLTAKMRYEKGRRSNPVKAVIHSGWIFFRSYILRQGFRDGRIGYLFAKLNAKSSFQRNMLLWRLGSRNHAHPQTENLP
jgi:glycosyltransferase involved in cell wall biosynthesis